LASTIYTGTASQTTAYAATDIYTLAIPTSSVTNISQQGANVVIQTGATALTLTGVTLAQLATANFALQGGGTVIFGDGATDAIADQFGNTLTGTTNGDILVGLGGGDTIIGNNGANLIFGGSAVTDPNDGGDTISSGTGNDTIYGNGGNDSINSGGGADIIFGGVGLDTITTGALTGTVSVYGGGGFLDTVDGADVINIQSSTGDLFVTGNAGNDFITVTTASGNSSVYGGVGADTIDVTATAGNFMIGGGSSSGNTDVDTITFNGSGSSSVTIYGGVGVTDANDGRDVINATVASGSASIYGNAGDDLINLRAEGVASVYGGTGSDVIAVSSLADTARVQIFGGPSAAGTLESLSVAGLAAGAAATIYGGTGINDSADGADLITGGASNDTLYGNGGNDTIISGSGNNSLFGGAGDDIFVANDGTFTTLQSTTINDYVAGSDTVLVNSALIGTGTSVGASANAIQFTGTTQDTLNITGTLTATGSTVFSGRVDNGGTANTVDATDGILGVNTSSTGASVAGGANADRLFGNAGADTLTGGAGNDTITGGAGADRIDVGAGNDVVVVRTGDASIVGFADVAPTTTAVAPGAGDTFTGTEVIFGLTTGDTIVTGNTALTADAGTVGTLEQNEFVIVGGTYNTLTGAFTVGTAGAGPDSILIYDGSSAAGVQQEAIVLVGVTQTEGGSVAVTGGTLDTFGA